MYSFYFTLIDTKKKMNMTNKSSCNFLFPIFFFLFFSFLFLYAFFFNCREKGMYLLTYDTDSWNSVTFAILWNIFVSTGHTNSINLNQNKPNSFWLMQNIHEHTPVEAAFDKLFEAHAACLFNDAHNQACLAFPEVTLYRFQDRLRSYLTFLTL